MANADKTTSVRITAEHREKVDKLRKKMGWNVHKAMHAACEALLRTPENKLLGLLENGK